MSGRFRRIVWFYDDLDQSGGAQRLALEGMRHFESRGIENHYLAYRRCEPGAAFDGAYHPRVRSLGEGAQQPQAPARWRDRCRVPWWTLRHRLSRLRWLRETIREIAPDIVMTEGTWGQVIHVWLATLGTRTPYAVMIAGSLFAIRPDSERTKYAWIFRRHFREIRESMPGYRQFTPDISGEAAVGVLGALRNELHALLKRTAIRGARCAFVHSRRNQSEVRKLYGRDAAIFKGAFSVKALEPTSSASEALPPSLAGKRIIAGVSRFVVHKRLDLCLRAFAQIRRTAPDLALVLGGRSYAHDSLRVPEEELLALARELGVAQDVFLPGYLSEPELRGLYRRASAFVSMDAADFDIAPLEALASGCSVVWSAEMEFDEDLRGLGRVFPAEPTPAGVSAALERALAAPPRRAWDAKERSALGRYTWEENFERMLGAMEAAAG